MRIRSGAIGGAVLALAAIGGVGMAQTTAPETPADQPTAASLPAPPPAPAEANIWEMLAAGAAVASVIVSAVGLRFIYQQLKHSREAIQASTEAAHAAAQAAEIAFGETRPWLKLEMHGSRGLGVGTIHFSKTEDGLTPITFGPRFFNIGKTPALAAGIAATVITDPNDIHETWARMLSEGVELGKAVFPGDNGGGDMTLNLRLPSPPKGDALNFTLIIGAFYRSREGGPWHGTPFVTVPVEFSLAYLGPTVVRPVIDKGKDVDVQLFSGTDLHIGPT